MRRGGGAERCARSTLSASRFDHLQPSADAACEFGRAPQRARIDLDRHDACGPFEQQRAGEAAGPGSDFDHRALSERAGGASDAARQVEVEQEMLAERLRGIEAVGGDGLAQRRQPGERLRSAMLFRSRAGAPCRRPCQWRRSGSPGRRGRCRRCRAPCRGRARCARRAGPA